MNRHVRAIVATLLCLPIVLPAFGGCAGPLSPAAASALEGTAAALCPLESMVPIVGTVAASACPAEVAALTAALTAAEGPVAATSQAQVAVYRAGPAGLVHVGTVAAAKAPVVQRLLLGIAAAKLPPPLPTALPAAVLPTLDAGVR